MSMSTMSARVRSYSVMAVPPSTGLGGELPAVGLDDAGKVFAREDGVIYHEVAYGLEIGSTQ